MNKFILVAFFLCAATSKAQELLPNEEAPLRFISIDGGALFGLIPITLLEHLEAKTGRPISELVDGMMGSSTGGIIAAMLNTPKQQWDLTPKFSAADIHQSYVENSLKVFNFQAFANSLAYLVGREDWANYPYAAAPFEELLQDRMGHVYLSHTLKPLMITAFNARTRRVDIFDSYLAKQSAHHDLPLRQAVRATTALEFFFGYGTVKYNTTDAASHWMDGGRLGYNDPTGFLCEELSRRFPHRKMVVYALGTGWGTSYLTRDYMHGLNPNLEVVRIEPAFEDRKESYVRWFLSLIAPSPQMAANWDVNYLAVMPFSTYINYIEDEAKRTLETPGFKRMLADFAGL